MGVSETTVSSMRKAGAEPRAGEAVKIAKALGTTVENLVGGNGDEYFQKYKKLKSEILRVIESN